MYIDRPAWKRRVHEAFSVHPVVAVTGPRQCGKTTLVRAIPALARTLAAADGAAP